MALVVADRVKEVTTTTGTGTISLGGAQTNFVAFSSALSDGDTTYYAIVDNNNVDYEVGLGTYASSGNTLARTTVLDSSNSGSAVDFGAGQKDVFITYPADKSVVLDASGNIASVTITSADINGGTIDGSIIGGTTAAAGTFTTANATTVNATTVDATNLEVTNLKAKDGTSAGSIADSTGVVTLASSVLTTTDINGGTADNVVIGAATPAAGTFTTANATTVDTTNIEVTNLKAKDGTAAGSIADSTGVVTIASAVLTTADINGGSADNVTIGGSTAAVGTFTTANATTVDTTNIEVTNIKAKDGTSAGSIADSTGVVTLASSVLTTADINGGTADNVVIGGATAAAGTFTNLTASGTLSFPDNSISGDDIDGGTISNFASTGIDDNATSTQFTIGTDDAQFFSPTLPLAVGLTVGGNTSIRGDLDTTGSVQIDGTLTVGDGSGADQEIRIYKSDNNVADHIQFYNGTTRVGEIGTEDTTWLRINQETVSNIYTPRYIRADNGFFVDGTSLGITGTGAFLGTTGDFSGTVTAPTYAFSASVNLDETGGVVRLTTGSGYVDMGPANTTYCHFQTDRGQFYFNKRLDIDGGEIRGYNSHIALRPFGSSTIGLRLEGSSTYAQLQYQINTSYTAGVKIQAYYGTPVITSRGAADTTDRYGFMFYTSAIVPGRWGYSGADNQMDLGASSNRWDDVYATNGTIQTSDAREKQDIEELTEAERRVAVAAKGLLRKYRWKDKVAEKGDEARVHFGIIAQDLMAAFEAEGLDPSRYAMFIKSEWWIGEKQFEAQEDEYNDEGELVVQKGDISIQPDYQYDNQEEAPDDAEYGYRLGVRYSELLAFIIAAI